MKCTWCEREATVDVGNPFVAAQCDRRECFGETIRLICAPKRAVRRAQPSPSAELHMFVWGLARDAVREAPLDWSKPVEGWVFW